jgi:hypothetical protein
MGRRMLTAAMVAFAAVPACGGAEESSEAGAAHGGEEADNAPQSFTVRLDSETTAENVIPQIVIAGRGQLAAMCEAAQPGAWVRILNPLASGAYTDVLCTSVLDGDGPTGEASAALVSDESDGPIGTVQQKWSPFGLACSVLTMGAGLVASYALCPRATNPDDKKNCDYVTAGGLSGLGLLCFLL